MVGLHGLPYTSHHWFIQQELRKTTLSHALVLQVDSDKGLIPQVNLQGHNTRKIALLCKG